MKVKFFTTARERSPVEEFFQALPKETRLEIADAITLLENGQKLAMPLSRNLASIRPGLHELRFRDKSGQVRMIYFLKGNDAIYFIHAFRKKAQHLPLKEINLILKRLREI